MTCVKLPTTALAMAADHRTAAQEHVNRRRRRPLQPPQGLELFFISEKKCSMPLPPAFHVSPRKKNMLLTNEHLRILRELLPSNIKTEKKEGHMSCFISSIPFIYSASRLKNQKKNVRCPYPLTYLHAKKICC